METSTRLGPRNLGFRDLGFRVRAQGFLDWGRGISVYGLEFRIQGFGVSGFGVCWALSRGFEESVRVSGFHRLTSDT